MIHPNTNLTLINDKKGRGVVATKPIPKGTITYIKDGLEIIIKPGDPRLGDPKYREILDTYTYTDKDGTRILSWDHAKYVNHCCQCNTISTGYGFEIATRDIEPGEEITDEYGLFNFNEELELDCELTPCRRVVSGRDVDTYYLQWDEIVKKSLQCYTHVIQPLEQYMKPQVRKALYAYLKHGRNYVSVLELKYPKKSG